MCGAQSIAAMHKSVTGGREIVMEFQTAHASANGNAAGLRKFDDEFQTS
jgi:hypothetical protein